MTCIRRFPYYMKYVAFADARASAIALALAPGENHMTKPTVTAHNVRTLALQRADVLTDDDKEFLERVARELEPAVGAKKDYLVTIERSAIEWRQYRVAACSSGGAEKIVTAAIDDEELGQFALVRSGVTDTDEDWFVADNRTVLDRTDE